MGVREEGGGGGRGEGGGGSPDERSDIRVLTRCLRFPRVAALLRAMIASSIIEEYGHDDPQELSLEKGD
jgi:hypothetical protein